ncbi:MAG: hypothetical protein JO231_06205 [Acidobacteria bacterium]|nr:hypothetical protein [Acidobacteriota bacterium]
MIDSVSLPVVFSAIGAVAGLILQQGIDVWKTRTSHRQALQARFFELKLQTAVDYARSLDALVATYQARLAEVAERTRDDENFYFLEVARGVVDIQTKALERDYDRYVGAAAVLELVFGPTVVTAALEHGVTLELNSAWREFDDAWRQMQVSLERLLPESRMEELRQQRERGSYDETAHDEMQRWMDVYKSKNAEMRSFLPRLVDLTLQAEQHRRMVLQAMRAEMTRYRV